MDIENIVMQIIINSGEARSFCLNAIKEGRKGNLDVASELLQKAKHSLSIAHNSQTELLHQEANGNTQEVSLVMVHAQDHLMNALTVRDLAVEMIELIKEMR